MHRMRCASLSWPPTRLQSQADQPWIFAYIKNHQLRYACIGPVKTHIIRRLRKVPPSNVSTYQCRSALDTVVWLYLPIQKWSFIRQPWDLNEKHINISDTSQCPHFWPCLPYSVHYHRIMEKKTLRGDPLQALLLLKKNSNSANIGLGLVTHISSKVSSLRTDAPDHCRFKPLLFVPYDERLKTCMQFTLFFSKFSIQYQTEQM